jgi:hypothetical protein
MIVNFVCCWFAGRIQFVEERLALELYKFLDDEEFLFSLVSDECIEDFFSFLNSVNELG